MASPLPSIFHHGICSLDWDSLFTELEDRMRYRFVTRLRVSMIALAIVGASLSAFATAASAATFTASNTVEFEEAISKVNTAGGANTIVLSAGSYLPGATVTFTKPSSVTTIEGPAGSPSLQGAPATLEGTAVEPFPSELFVVEPGASVTFKNVELIHAGGAGVPATRDLGQSETQPGGKITLESSLVGGNIGQGISIGPGAELTARNSTFSSGEAFGVINNGTTKLFNSTVAFNTGGGIENKGSLALTNTIVADNKGAGDCKGAANTTDHSLDSNGSCGVGALSKVNPLLTELVNDGGTTLVDVPEAASPAIGAGDPATCTTTDQRGVPRSSPCTIGAVERGTQVLEASFTHNESHEAPFGQPSAVAVDPSGNIWVADSAHDHVLQFNSSREFVRQIGSEGSGESQFKGIGGLATNSSGDLYVTDTGNDRVQEFSSTGGHLATFGSSAPGNGQLLSPSAVAIDSSGNVWVLNGKEAQAGGRIVEFSASGTFISQFGSKGTAGGQLLYADGLAFSGGHLYVSEASPQRVQELSTTGEFIGQFDEKGSLPSGIASDPSTGNLDVSDINGHVSQFSAAGSLIDSFGSPGSSNGQLWSPQAVAVGSTGTIYVADTHNQRVEEWKAGSPPTFANAFTHNESRAAPFGEPTAVAVDPSGNIWVADSAHDHVLEFNASLGFVRQIGSEGSGESQFKGIGGIATNSSGDVYVTDTGNDRVQEFSSSGAHLATFGSSAPGNGQLLSPTAVAIDSSGNVWVLNGIGAQEGGRIVEFSASGTFLSQFGSKGTGPGQLLYADGLAFSGGHLYVSEVSPQRVQELSTTGEFIRQFDEKGSVPCAIATDPTTGNLYVSDCSNFVRLFSASGSLIDSFGSYGTGAGQMLLPEGIAVGSSGTIYIADSANQRIDAWAPIP